MGIGSKKIILMLWILGEYKDSIDNDDSIDCVYSAGHGNYGKICLKMLLALFA